MIATLTLIAALLGSNINVPEEANTVAVNDFETRWHVSWPDSLWTPYELDGSRARLEEPFLRYIVGHHRLREYLAEDHPDFKPFSSVEYSYPVVIDTTVIGEVKVRFGKYPEGERWVTSMRCDPNLSDTPGIRNLLFCREKLESEELVLVHFQTCTIRESLLQDQSGKIVGCCRDGRTVSIDSAYVDWKREMKRHLRVEK